MIRGHVSSLRGAISSEQGSISSLRAGGYGWTTRAAIRDAVKRHENEIARLEREIRDYNADAKVAAVEREIASARRRQEGRRDRSGDPEVRPRRQGRRRSSSRSPRLDVDGKIARLEKKIDALDADRRERELEKRRDEELKRLEAAIAAIR